MSRFMRLGAAAALLIVGVALGAHFAAAPVSESETSGNAGSGLALARPAFAQPVQRIFLDEEAGISAYVWLEEGVDLAAVRPLYSVVEDETDEYIIGTLELAGYSRTWWPHMWVHRDGWVIVYYNPEQPTSRLMHWPGYDRSAGQIGSTTLREGLLAVGVALEVEEETIDANLGYYHWQYPEASRLLAVVGSGTFRYTLPDEFTFYEGSWSHRGFDIHATAGAFATHVGWSETKVDDRSLHRGEHGTYTRVGTLQAEDDEDAPDHLSPGRPHEVSAEMRSTRSGSWTAAAIFFVYR